MEISLRIYLLFGIVIFFILDLIALIFDIFIITAPLGIFISFLSTVVYIGYTFLVYGGKKGAEKLFNIASNFKSKKYKQLFKKGTKLIGGSTIPFVNVWAVWDDYKEEMRELNAKKAELRSEIEEKQAENKIQQEALEEEEKYAKEEADKIKEEEEINRQNVEKEEEEEKAEINPWISSNDSNSKKDIKKKKRSIEEEVGGVRTGMNREDYDEGLTDFSKKETYDKMVAEAEEKKQKAMRERQDIEATREAKKKQEEINKKNTYDKEFIRRFGLDAYTRMKRDREIPKTEEEKKDDKYREEV